MKPRINAQHDSWVHSQAYTFRNAAMHLTPNLSTKPVGKDVNNPVCIHVTTHNRYPGVRIITIRTARITAIGVRIIAIVSTHNRYRRTHNHPPPKPVRLYGLRFTYMG